jgi:hypothetical protein
MLPTPDKFDPIYAAIAGAFIALTSSILTAWLGGRHARKRQEKDLAHSATQKELERIHSLRREVYLPFSDAFAAAVGFVPTIPSCPQEHIRLLQPITELGRHFARINLIAPPSVIEPATRGFLYLQTVVTTLVTKRFEIDEAASDLAQNQQMTQWMLDRQKSLNSRMDGHVDSGEHRPQVQVLHEEHVDLTRRVKESLAAHEPLNQRKFKLEMALQRQAAAMLPPLKEHSSEAFLAIRNEIGLPLDAKWYKEFSDRTIHEAMENLTKFQFDLERAIITPN